MIGRTQRLISTASIALLVACGCDIRISEEEVRLRYHPDGDRLDLLLIYKGVSASDAREGPIAGARELALRVLDGRRIISFLGWPLDWDLDELEEELRQSTPEDEADAFEQALLADLLPDCVLEEIGGFLDDRERLSAYQLYRIEGFSRVVELWNRRLSRWVLEAAEDPEAFARDTPHFDDRTRELWRLHAASGEPWIFLADDGFAFDAPMTGASLERVRAELAEVTADPDGGPHGPAALAQLLAYLTLLEHHEERLVLEFRPVRGLYAFTFWDDEPYDPALRQALEAEGVTPDETVDLELVRGILPRDGEAE